MEADPDMGLGSFSSPGPRVNNGTVAPTSLREVDMAWSVTLALFQSFPNVREGSGHSGPRLQSEVICFQMRSGKGKLALAERSLTSNSEELSHDNLYSFNFFYYLD